MLQRQTSHGGPVEDLRAHAEQRGDSERAFAELAGPMTEDELLGAARYRLAETPLATTKRIPPGATRKPSMAGAEQRLVRSGPLRPWGRCPANRAA